MVVRLRSIACMTVLTAMLAPWVSVTWQVAHLALDDHHHISVAATDPHRPDAADALHGHEHDDATPAHSHDTTPAARPSPLATPCATAHPSVTGGMGPAAIDGTLPFVRSAPFPPQRIPIVLRV